MFVTRVTCNRGAFLLAADGGLHGGESREDGGAEQEPMLSTDGPTCLKKVRLGTDGIMANALHTLGGHFITPPLAAFFVSSERV